MPQRNWINQTWTTASATSATAHFTEVDLNRAINNYHVFEAPEPQPVESLQELAEREIWTLLRGMDVGRREAEAVRLNTYMRYGIAHVLDSQPAPRETAQHLDKQTYKRDVGYLRTLARRPTLRRSGPFIRMKYWSKANRREQESVFDTVRNRILYQIRGDDLVVRTGSPFYQTIVDNVPHKAVQTRNIQHQAHVQKLAKMLQNKPIK